MKPPRAAHTQWDESGKRIPIRTCVVCRQRLAQSSVLRLARDVSGSLQADPQRQMVGRGMYICASNTCHTAKALIRISRADAPRLAALLENRFKPL
jgi:predicted RNA-binding protein YlxR (DUF448 family)